MKHIVKIIRAKRTNFTLFYWLGCCRALSPLQAHSFGFRAHWPFDSFFALSPNIFPAAAGSSLKVTSSDRWLEKFENSALYSFAAFQSCSVGRSGRTGHLLNGFVLRSPQRKQSSLLPAWCAAVSAAILFHADKHRLSFWPAVKINMCID